MDEIDKLIQDIKTHDLSVRDRFYIPVLPFGSKILADDYKSYKRKSKCFRIKAFIGIEKDRFVFEDVLVYPLFMGREQKKKFKDSLKHYKLLSVFIPKNRPTYGTSFLLDVLAPPGKKRYEGRYSKYWYGPKTQRYDYKINFFLKLMNRTKVAVNGYSKILIYDGSVFRYCSVNDLENTFKVPWYDEVNEVFSLHEIDCVESIPKHIKYSSVLPVNQEIYLEEKNSIRRISCYGCVVDGFVLKLTGDKCQKIFNTSDVLRNKLRRKSQLIKTSHRKELRGDYGF